MYPPQHLTDAQKAEIVKIATQIGESVHCVGMMNIQFIVADQVYVIEVNPRASRTVPFMSKITHKHLAQLATQMIIGKSLAEIGLEPGLFPEPDSVYVKAPVFSFAKLPGAPTALSPEMKSTGEDLGHGKTLGEALHRAFFDSYHFDSHVTGPIMVTPTDAKNTELMDALASAGYPHTVYELDQAWPDDLAFVLATEDESDLAKQLTTRALSHEVTLFTAQDTAAALATVPSVERA